MHFARVGSGMPYKTLGLETAVKDEPTEFLT